MHFSRARACSKRMRRARQPRAGAAWAAWPPLMRLTDACVATRRMAREPGLQRPPWAKSALSNTCAPRAHPVEQKRRHLAGKYLNNHGDAVRCRATLRITRAPLFTMQAPGMQALWNPRPCAATAAHFIFVFVRHPPSMQFRCATTRIPNRRGTHALTQFAPEAAWQEQPNPPKKRPPANNPLRQKSPRA